MTFDERIEVLWENPNAVDLELPFLYFISVTDDDGQEYRYLGKARHAGRLREYRNNMLRIRAGRERGAIQGYRAVHLAMYAALQSGWLLIFKPLENCSAEGINELERKRIRELVCNLNAAKTWRVEQIQTLSLKELLRETRT